MKHSPIWDTVENFELSENMRIKKSSGDPRASITKFVLKVEDGKLETSKVRLPKHLMLTSDSSNDLCQLVIQDLEHNITNPTWLCSRNIISPTNSAVDEVTDVMISNS